MNIEPDKTTFLGIWPQDHKELIGKRAIIFSISPYPNVEDVIYCGTITQADDNRDRTEQWVTLEMPGSIIRSSAKYCMLVN